jgi:hypothetical protein
MTGLPKRLSDRELPARDGRWRPLSEAETELHSRLALTT